IKSASPIIKNVRFRNNYAFYYGGAVYANSGSNPQFGNVLFLNNKSGSSGGAVFSAAQVKFYNCVWSGNYSGNYGGAVYDNSSTSLVYNSIAWDNEARLGYDNFRYGVSSFYSIFNNAVDQNGNLDQEPGFVSVEKADFRLKEGSPAINSGNNDYLPDWLISDFYGNSRVLEDTLDIGIAEGGVVVPTLLSPSPDSVYHISSDETVLFEWTVEDASVLENISAFQLEYIVNSDTIIIEEIAEQQYEIGGFQPKDTVSWSVSYIDEQGFTTWSSSSSFFIGRGRPVFVTSGGTGDGSSWENGIDLIDALITAVPGDSLWVASGIYTPTTTADRSISFELRDNVKLYGGFAGTESSFDERNWNINRTVLSGDIGETEVATDNTYQVVRMIGTSEKPVSAKTIIDGVVIEAGYADSSSSNDGGGLFLFWASPVVKNVWFRNHFSYDDGGAVYGDSESRAEFGNVIFTNNESGDDGGAVYSYSGFKFYNCLWYDNYSGYWGGAARGNMFIINSIAWNNQAENGSNDFSGSYTINNSIYLNSSNSGGNLSESPDFVDGDNSDFRLTENSPAINNGKADVVPDWLTEDYFGNARVLEDTIDIGVAEGFVIVPVLESPEDGSVIFLNENSEVVLDWSLDASVSENISAYKLEYIVNSLDTMLIDNIAEQQFTLNGISPTDSVKWRVAYEDNNELFNWSLSSLFTIYRGHPLFVVPDGTGDGSSWTSATNLQNALDVSVAGDSIWVAAGTYKPTDTDDRNISFEIKENVKLFGGFAGTETTFAERNLVENQTILSGDIGEEGVDTDNSYHVLQMIGSQAAPITLKTVVDGLVIEKGYADEQYMDGGGLLLEWASPIVRNVWLRDNYALDDGGAVYGDNESHAQYGNVIFTKNESGNDGGAVYSLGIMKFYNCLWYGNISGAYGGAVYSDNAIVNNSIALGNVAEWSYNDFTYMVDVTNSIYSGGYSGDGNISQNPDFVDPSNNDFRLKEGSPAINAVSTENLPDWLVTDYYGNFRVEEDTVDIGAIEGWVITPTLVSPADKSWFEADITSTTLEWGWNDSIPNNINGFAVEYIINGGEPQLLENLADLETELTGFQPADEVSWRVGSLENTGFTNWSESRTFTVYRDHPLYVKPGARGNGTSWLDAMDLKDAMAISIENDEVWVAAGTYKPTDGSERNATFELKNGMKLYGGFGGFESSVEERDWMANETILSGDIGVEGDVNDNSYNVVRIRGTEDRLFEDNVVDGFIIEKGKAQYDGGGVYIRRSSPELRNIWLRDNQADRWGGAVYTENGSNPTFSNVLFVNNSAASAGAAVMAASSATFNNCLWYGNTTTDIGGAIYKNNWVSVEVNNSIAWNNQASSDSDFTFTTGIEHSVFSDADGSNGNIAKDPLFVDAENDIFHLQYGSPAINAGDNAQVSDEVLTDFAGFDRIFGDKVDIGPFEYLQIQPVAPANGGSGTKEYSMLMMLNLVWGISDGTIEPQTNIPSEFEYQMKLWKVGDEDNLLEDGPFSARSGIDGTNNSTIIGDLEYGSAYQWTIGLDYGDHVNWSEPSTFYIGHDYTIKVKEGSTGTTGASWDDAFGTLHEALDFALPGDEIWVAEGKYYPVTPADPNNVTQTEREQALSLKQGMIIYGGLAGDESNALNRNHVEHPVILSGDIGVDGDDSDNSIHLFRNEFDAGTPLEQGAVIEGFIFEDATGSAIYNVNASPSVEFSVFRNNMGDDGGAVYNDGSSPRFFNVLFHDNEASGNGGAIYADENSQPELLSCTVAHNRATNTGGLYGYFDVKNSIVYANENGAFSDNASQVVYSCVEGGYEGEENISYEPMWTDPENRDYSLKEFSPCIEQGNNEWFSGLFGYDLAKNSRTHWINTDMGAFEATENGKLEIVESSVDTDGLTDFINSITIRFNQPIAIDTTVSPLINPVVDAELKVSQEDPSVLIISHPGLQTSTDYHLELPGGQVTLANNDKIVQWFVEYDFSTRACVPVVLSVENSDVAVCPRASVSLGVGIEGDAMDYSWSYNDQEVIAQDSDTLFIESVMAESLGSYTIVVNDWCGSSDEVTLNLQYKAGTELVVPEPKWNTVFFVDNSSGNLSEFRWYFNGEEVSQKQYVDVKSMGYGDLTVRAFDNASQCLIYGEVEPLKSASLKSAVVSPNPVVAGNPVDIFLPVVSEQSRIRLYDMRGGLLIDREFGESSILQLEDTDLSSGVYLLQIEYNDGFIENKKLIIE
ncbi:T9SS type A sorting domain-containing protein, partial [Marinilabilia sp.]|uniref:T9SS type A sorting domain-containing protein n=1 Tax=Marinilabilia sp. TaxID=2021252 RepID=UPI0025B877D7